jgi:hypothetical protein
MQKLNDLSRSPSPLSRTASLACSIDATPAGAKPALSGFSPNGLILKTCSERAAARPCQIT